jgi:glyoxylase-like metal-dependent hydrolase (beta-lactamase superfamily II)
MPDPSDHLTAHPHGVWAIDTGYYRPRMDASHLVLRDGHAALIDCGTTTSVPRLLECLQVLGVEPDQIEWLFLTHVHLDHAGGAGALLEHLPRARVVVHPRGAPHLIEPARLEAATRAVYGDAVYDSLYGALVPVPAERVVVVEDGERILLGESVFEVLHTPGHALHHCCFHDRAGRAVFAGDTFGVSYRETDVRGRPFIIPATTPTHFDPDQLHNSIDRLLAVKPEAIYLTHYSRMTDLERLAEDLHADLVAFVEIAKRCRDEADRVAAIACMMRAYLGARLDEHGFTDDEQARDAVLGMDIQLNAQGIVAWLERARH